MQRFILQIVVLSLVVFYGLPYFFHGIHVDGGRTAIIAAIVFAFINFAIRPVLKVISIPFNIISFGLFGLLVNVLLFWFVASIIDGFTVVNFMSALWGAISMTVVTWILDKISK